MTRTTCISWHRWAVITASAATMAATVAVPSAGASQGSPPAHAGHRLEAVLTGAAEVPGPGDPDGSGDALVTVIPGLGRVCYTLEVTGIDPATAAHIHEAPAGVAGPVVVGLTPPTSGASSGCVDVGRALALDINRNPSDYYVNVHNAAFQGGAVRGQLTR